MSEFFSKRGHSIFCEYYELIKNAKTCRQKRFVARGLFLAKKHKKISQVQYNVLVRPLGICGRSTRGTRGIRQGTPAERRYTQEI